MDLHCLLWPVCRKLRKTTVNYIVFFEFLQDMEVQDSTPRADSSEEPKEPARLSPNSLERRFLAELHQLDSMEMSMKQLTGVERTRAVSMAQQETVSLAQMLKV